MPRRQPAKLPKVWLMTDERMGDRLLPSLRALAKGSGVIFRHYGLPADERRALFDQVKRIARARRMTLIIGGPAGLRRRADGFHGCQRAGRILTLPVHNLRERVAAERAGADLIFVSPLFATASHPGSGVLGRVRFGQLIQGARVRVVALGGMTRKRAETLRCFDIYGWAAIDALCV
jgi:thiamine-phosphate pyrophosphorylase